MSRIINKKDGHPLDGTYEDSARPVERLCSSKCYEEIFDPVCKCVCESFSEIYRVIKVSKNN